MSLERKIQEALALGVPMNEINRVIQGNAMKARDPAVRQQLMNAGGVVRMQQGGSVYDQQRAAAMAARDARANSALQGAGLRTIGNTQSNLAAGIGQAGLRNRAFTPTSGLGNIAQGIEARGAAQAQYQDRLGGIAGAERAAAEAAAEEAKAEQAKNKEQADLFRRYSVAAQKALAYVDPATPALNALSQAEAVANKAYAVSAVIPIVNQGTSALNQVRENEIHKWMRNWAQKSEHNSKSYEAFKLLEGSVTELTTTALKAQGPGPKTDFDFVVAARSTADLSATPGAIKQSLNRLITNAGEELAALGVPAPVASTETITLPSAPYEEVKVGKSVEGGRGEVLPKDTPISESLGNKLEGAVEGIKDTFTKDKETQEVSSRLDTKGETPQNFKGAQNNPHAISKSVFIKENGDRRNKVGIKTRLVAWAKLNKVKPTDYVTFDGDVVLYSRLLGAL